MAAQPIRRTARRGILIWNVPIVNVDKIIKYFVYEFFMVKSTNCELCGCLCENEGGMMHRNPPYPHPRCPPAPRGLRRVRAGTRRACSSLPWKNVKQKWKELFYNIVRCHGNKYNYRESIYSMLIYMFLIELLPRIHLKGEGRQNHYHIRIRV